MKRLLLIAAAALSVSGLQAAGLRDLAASTLSALKDYADYHSGLDIKAQNTSHAASMAARERAIGRHLTANPVEVPVNLSTSDFHDALGQVRPNAELAVLAASSLAQDDAPLAAMDPVARINWPKTKIAGRSLASLGRAAAWGVAAQQTFDKKSWFRKLLNKKIANRHLRRLALLSPALLALLADAAIAAPTKQHSVLGAAGRGLKSVFRRQDVSSGGQMIPSPYTSSMNISSAPSAGLTGLDGATSQARPRLPSASLVASENKNEE